jgi:1-acyl-sn-glycerol-3-phosphate acyltransferase
VTSKRPRGLGKRAWVLTKCIRFVLLGLAITRIVKVRVVNRNVVPKKGAVILASNHPSMIDPFFVWMWLRRQAVGIAAVEIWLHNPFVAWAMNVLGHIPVHRTSVESGKRAMQLAEEFLALDGAVMIFPEGGCVLRGQVRTYKPGVYWIAKNSGAPVIPVTVIGSNDVLPLKSDRPKKRWIYLSRKVQVVYGQPLLTADYPDTTSFLAALRQAIESPIVA